MTDLLEALARYVERYPDERRMVSRFFALLEDWPACLNRDHLPGHLTASAWVVDPSGSGVLFTHHKKLGKWLQLGGHADGQKRLSAVARREAQEEAGATELILLTPWDLDVFDIDVHPIPQAASPGDHEHFDVRFAFFWPDAAKPVVSEESHDVRWIPLDGITSYTEEPSILRMCDKWAACVDQGWFRAGSNAPSIPD